MHLPPASAGFASTSKQTNQPRSYSLNSTMPALESKSRITPPNVSPLLSSLNLIGGCSFTPKGCSAPQIRFPSGCRSPDPSASTAWDVRWIWDSGFGVGGRIDIFNSLETMKVGSARIPHLFHAHSSILHYKIGSTHRRYRGFECPGSMFSRLSYRHAHSRILMTAYS